MVNDLSCRLVNEIKAGSVKKINTSTMAFKCMENINNFLASATTLGVPSQEQFQTVQNAWNNLHKLT